MQLEVEVAGDVQLSRQILRIGERVVHARPAFDAIAQMLFGVEREQFTSEGRYASGGWAPLAASTLERKTTDRILVETGGLERSLTERGGDNVLVVGEEFLVFGTSDPKAKYHQQGTGRMPRRRPLELRSDNRNTIVKIFQRYVLTGELALPNGTPFETIAGGLA